MVDGRVFSQLLFNKKSLEQLGFLIQFSSKVFFYEMAPALKADLVGFVRDYLYMR